MIKVVFFDVDGVLIDSLEANFTYFKNLFSYLGHPFPSREEYPHLFHLTQKQVIEKMVPQASEEEVLRIMQVAASKRSEFYETSLLKTPKGLREVVASLSEKYPLGIVTSRLRGGVFSLPPLVDLEPFFQTAVYYEDTDKHKPEPEPLFLACERLAVKPSEAVYIGDARTDMLAAQSAGMRGIAYAESKFEGADLQTTNFEDLPELIDLLAFLPVS